MPHTGMHGNKIFCKTFPVHKATVVTVIPWINVWNTASCFSSWFPPGQLNHPRLDSGCRILWSITLCRIYFWAPLETAHMSRKICVSNFEIKQGEDTGPWGMLKKSKSSAWKQNIQLEVHWILWSVYQFVMIIKIVICTIGSFLKIVRAVRRFNNYVLDVAECLPDLCLPSRPFKVPKMISTLCLEKLDLKMFKENVLSKPDCNWITITARSPFIVEAKSEMELMNADSKVL